MFMPTPGIIGFCLLVPALCAEAGEVLNLNARLSQRDRMRIGKPLLITTTSLGLAIGLFEAFHLAGAIGTIALVLVALFAVGITWILRMARAEERDARAAREKQAAPDGGAAGPGEDSP
jgi:hypothetical protein